MASDENLDKSREFARFYQTFSVAYRQNLRLILQLNGRKRACPAVNLQVPRGQVRFRNPFFSRGGVSDTQYERLHQFGFDVIVSCRRKSGPLFRCKPSHYDLKAQENDSVTKDGIFWNRLSLVICDATLWSDDLSRVPRTVFKRFTYFFWISVTSRFYVDSTFLWRDVPDDGRLLRSWCFLGSGKFFFYLLRLISERKAFGRLVARAHSGHWPMNFQVV